MQTSKPPCLTLDELERLNREFSWEDKEDSKKIHTISWHHLQEYLGRGFGYQEDERYKPSVACKVELEDATIPATTVGTNTVAKVALLKDYSRVKQIRDVLVAPAHRYSLFAALTTQSWVDMNL
ncbi:hypothetical protein M9H77_17887 [Catharanthus roseus]|uniref:Uncharacterized protein n=1 Tax=Catharanthus roseus TaxID=4058 RepID=A0ACC0B5X7_CATRO|nr:hypothetical protein M9H77_17887 [Catharanthus roseus]